jgi:hypothetical protein
MVVGVLKFVKNGMIILYFVNELKRMVIKRILLSIELIMIKIILQIIADGYLKPDNAGITTKTLNFFIDGAWFLLTDLARKYNVSRDTIKRMANDGRLKYDQWIRGSKDKNE